MKFAALIDNEGVLSPRRLIAVTRTLPESMLSLQVLLTTTGSLVERAFMSVRPIDAQVSDFGANTIQVVSESEKFCVRFCATLLLLSLIVALIVQPPAPSKNFRDTIHVRFTDVAVEFPVMRQVSLDRVACPLLLRLITAVLVLIKPFPSGSTTVIFSRIVVLPFSVTLWVEILVTKEITGAVLPTVTLSVSVSLVALPVTLFHQSKNPADAGVIVTMRSAMINIPR